MRKRRQLTDGADYHVSVRINRGEMVFKPREDKKLLLNVIERAKKKFDFQIKDFSIMGNHVHFIIKPGKGISLSKIMQWILSVFAINWNHRHHLTGHVWGERFFSRVIAGVVDMLRTFMYIDDNPVNAQLVHFSWQWEFGGLWHHQKGLTTIVDEPDPMISMFLPEHAVVS